MARVKKRNRCQLVAVCLILLFTPAEPQCVSDCTGKSGNYPDCQSCSLFIECNQDYYYRKSCESGTYFDGDSQTCTAYMPIYCDQDGNYVGEGAVGYPSYTPDPTYATTPTSYYATPAPYTTPSSDQLDSDPFAALDSMFEPQPASPKNDDPFSALDNMFQPSNDGGMSLNDVFNTAADPYSYGSPMDFGNTFDASAVDYGTPVTYTTANPGTTALPYYPTYKEPYGSTAAPPAYSPPLSSGANPPYYYEVPYGTTASPSYSPNYESQYDNLAAPAPYYSPSTAAPPAYTQTSPPKYNPVAAPPPYYAPASYPSTAAPPTYDKNYSPTYAPPTYNAQPPSYPVPSSPNTYSPSPSPATYTAPQYPAPAQYTPSSPPSYPSYGTNNTAATQDYDDCSNSCSGKSDGNYPDCTFCNKYLVCSKGVVSSYTCGYGQYYDEKVGACQQDTQYQCYSAPSASASPTYTQQVGSEPHAGSYSDNTVFNYCTPSCRDHTGASLPSGQYLHCHDCSLYVHCSNGIYTETRCPATTIYEGTVGVCVFGSKSDCKQVTQFPGNTQPSYTGQAYATYPSPAPQYTSPPATSYANPPYSSPPATPYANPPATPYANPPATPYANPPATPYANPPATPYANPPATPYANPPATPYANPPATPYANPQATPYANPPATSYSNPQATPYASPSAYANPPATPYANPPATSYSNPQATPYASPSAYANPPAKPYANPPATSYSNPPTTPYASPSAYANPPATSYTNPTATSYTSPPAYANPPATSYTNPPAYTNPTYANPPATSYTNPSAANSLYASDQSPKSPFTNLVSHQCITSCVTSGGRARENGIYPICNNCRSFIMCVWGLTTTQDCPAGTSFSNNLLVCDWDRAGKCTANGFQSLQAQNPGDGVMTVHPTLLESCQSTDGPVADGQYGSENYCNMYIRCERGQATRLFCDRGQLYAENQGACVADIDGICVQSSDDLGQGFAPVVPESQPRPVESTLPVFTGCIRSCIEGGIVRQNGRYSHCDYCNVILDCQGGAQAQYFCPDHEMYMEATGKCEKDFKGECYAEPFKLSVLDFCVDSCTDVADGRYSSCTYCNVYVDCIGGVEKMGFCQQGEKYGRVEGQCVVDTDHECTPDSGDMTVFDQCVEDETAPGNYQDGRYASCSYCNVYFERTNNVWERRFCSDRNKYVQASGACVEDTTGECFTEGAGNNTLALPPSHPDCIKDCMGDDGPVADGFYSHCEYCNAILTCIGGVTMFEFCSPGYGYNMDKGKCDLDPNRKCEEPLNLPEPITFDEPDNQMVLIKATRPGVNLLTACLDSCVGPNNQLAPDGYYSYCPEKSGYILCDKGRTFIYYCMEGATYLAENGTCMISSLSTAKHGQSVLREGELGHPACISNCFFYDKVAPSGRYRHCEHCAQSVVCSGNLMHRESCPVGTRYYSPAGTCDEDTIGQCWPSTNLPATSAVPSNALVLNQPVAKSDLVRMLQDAREGRLFWGQSQLTDYILGLLREMANRMMVPVETQAPLMAAPAVDPNAPMMGPQPLFDPNTNQYYYPPQMYLPPPPSYENPQTYLPPYQPYPTDPNMG
ncbi:uncharacterized protein LOC131956293 [Physella acuta]|uniref:uncharacterized protein LOC131956293 n=1 Tax=Physella acuta TaxID=109671 RepID=UPI0027DEA017|nr:uncharacterized protein LOC131956293 [Physella acuta]